MSAQSNPKRFYKDVSVHSENGRFCILLDGRKAKTRALAALSTPTKALADEIANEWRCQGEYIDRQTMPLTALLSVGLDGGETQYGEWRDHIIKYLSSDLVCYRAEKPVELVARQREVWGSYLNWFAVEFGPLAVASGISAIDQPEETIISVRAALETAEPEAVYAINTVTSITGSGVLALALWRQAFPVYDVFNASRLDEHFQEEKWGVDAEAKAREENIKREFLAVARFLHVLADG